MSKLDQKQKLVCLDCGQPMKKNRERKTVLSLDGGGVRALFQIKLLQRIKEEQKTCLCQLFDMVVGTSMGGVSALALCYGNLTSIEITLNKMLDHKTMSKLANESILDKVLGQLQVDPVYDGKGKTRVMEELYPGNFSDLGLPCVITGYNLEICQPYQFRSWNEKDGSIPISKIADITTAVPVYFPPIKHDNSWWVDGGIAEANPAMTAYAMAKDYFGQDTKIRILSIGTGVYRENWNDDDMNEWGAPRWLYHGLIDLLISAPTQAVTTTMAEILGSDWLRIDSPDITNIKLDDISEKSIKLLTQASDSLYEKKKEEIKILFS